MALSRFAVTPLPELFESRNSKRWMDKEVEDLLLPNLKAGNWEMVQCCIIHGCRTGRIFFKHFTPLLNDDGYPRIHGLDTSASMIEYANKNFVSEKDFKVGYFSWKQCTWKVMEMVDWVEPDENCLVKKIYSIHALQFERHYKEIFKRMNKAVWYDGQVYGLVLAQSKLFDVYKHISTLPEWKELAEDLYIPDWIKSGRDPKEVYQEALQDAGYIDLKIDLHPRTFTFPSSEECLEFYLALNPKPLEKHLTSDDLRNKLFQACLEYLDKEEIKSDVRGYKIEYTTMTFFARKTKPWTLLKDMPKTEEATEAVTAEEAKPDAEIEETKK